MTACTKRTRGFGFAALWLKTRHDPDITNVVAVAASFWVGTVGCWSEQPVLVDVTDEIDGETVKSGDIFLNDNCEMVFNRELLDEPEAKSNEVERFLLRAWVR